MPSDFDKVFAFAKLIATTLGEQSKTVLMNLRGSSDGDFDDSTADGATDEPSFGAIGVISRPRPPNVDGRAEIIAARMEDGLQPMAGRDLRVSKRYPPKDGDHALVHDAGGFLTVTDNGDVVPAGEREGLPKGTNLIAFAPALDDAGAVTKSHALILDSSIANASIVLTHADGMALLMTKEGNMILRGKGGANWIQISETEILLAGVVKLFGGVIAGNPQLAQPVALHTALAVLATALNAACVPGGPLQLFVAACVGPTAPQITAANAALSAIATAAAAVAAPATGASQTLKASPV